MAEKAADAEEEASTLEGDKKGSDEEEGEEEIAEEIVGGYRFVKRISFDLFLVATQRCFLGRV